MTWRRHVWVCGDGCQTYDANLNSRFAPLARIVVDAVSGSMCAVSPSLAHPELVFPDIRATDWDTEYTPYVTRRVSESNARHLWL